MDGGGAPCPRRRAATSAGQPGSARPSRCRGARAASCRSSRGFAALYGQSPCSLRSFAIRAPQASPLGLRGAREEARSPGRGRPRGPPPRARQASSRRSAGSAAASASSTATMCEHGPRSPGCLPHHGQVQARPPTPTRTRYSADRPATQAIVSPPWRCRGSRCGRRRPRPGRGRAGAGAVVGRRPRPRTGAVARSSSARRRRSPRARRPPASPARPRPRPARPRARARGRRRGGRNATRGPPRRGPGPRARPAPEGVEHASLAREPAPRLGGDRQREAGIREVGTPGAGAVGRRVHADRPHGGCQALQDPQAVGVGDRHGTLGGPVRDDELAAPDAHVDRMLRAAWQRVDEPAEGGPIGDQPRLHAGQDRLRLGEPADPALRQRDAPLLVARTVHVDDERLQAQLEVEPAGVRDAGQGRPDVGPEVDVRRAVADEAPVDGVREQVQARVDAGAAREGLRTAAGPATPSRRDRRGSGSGPASPPGRGTVTARRPRRSSSASANRTGCSTRPRNRRGFSAGPPAVARWSVRSPAPSSHDPSR